MAPAGAINEKVIPKNGERIYVFATLNGFEKLKLLHLLGGMERGALKSEYLCCEIYTPPIALIKWTMPGTIGWGRTLFQNLRRGMLQRRHLRLACVALCIGHF